MTCSSWLARLCQGATAFGLVLCTHPALAQTPATSTPTARELFDQGRALMLTKDYANACPKFDESQRLDPGGGTLLNLAVCNELLGKTATAWQQFHDALAVAEHDGRTDREELAHEHIDGLVKKLSRLRVQVPDEARTTGLIVRRNDVELDEVAWGVAVPIDPGQQTVEAAAPGKIPFKVSLIVGPDGDNKEVNVPRLASAAGEGLPKRASVERASVERASVERAGPSVTPMTTAEPASPTPRRAPARGTEQRWLGGIVGGVGVATLGIASYFVLKAISLDRASNRDCPVQNWCEGPGLSESTDALRYARAATYTTIAGVVLTGAGVVIVVSAPTSRSVGAGFSLGPALSAATLSGNF